MTEKHEFQFAGCHLPREVVQLLRDKRLGSTDLLLYVMVAALEGDEGCYASNAYLANSVGIGERGVQKHLLGLRELGLVTTTRFDGRRRWLRTCKPDTPLEGVAAVPVVATHKTLQLSKTMSGQSPDGGGVGFGVGKPKVPAKPPTPTDIKHAELLFGAVRGHLGPDHVLTRSRSPKQWAPAFEKLRRLDEITDDEVGRVLGWYVANIGGEYVPEAYAGDSFRKKFPAIMMAMKRRAFVPDEDVCPAAIELVRRLEPMGWPRGSGARLPGAIHGSLGAYTRWREIAVGFLKTQPGFGLHVLDVLPQPAAFIEQWFRDIHGRVTGWEKWDGQFRGMEWRPEHDRFRAWGWGLATNYTGHRDRWDKLMERMLEAVQNEG